MLQYVPITDFANPYSEAINRQRRALLGDRSALAMATLAALYQVDGDYKKSMEWINRTLGHYPGNETAKYLKALALLVEGNYKEGFKLYEHRFHVYPARGHIDRLCARWHGQPTDKVVYVWQDGGIGDVIMFLRFWPEVLRRAPNAQLLIDPRLIDLFAANGIARERMPRTGADLDKHFADKLGVPMQSLPLTLGIYQIIGGPYLYAPQALVDTWRIKLKDKPKIGFCWRGNSDHERDVTRSIPTDVALAIGAHCDVFSLQHEHLTGVNDWADTAAIIANMDMVISVDTAVAHLAAAMGKPTWMLIAYDFDWRWGQHAMISPWYDSVRLFRCPKHGDWDGAIWLVIQALGENGFWRTESIGH